LSDTLDTVGTIARSVTDAAYFAAAISGRRELIIDKPPAARLRIGICRTYEWKQAQPETVDALESAARRLAAAGAVVGEIKLPPTYANLVQAQTDIMLAEQSQSLAHERLTHWPQLSTRLQGILAAGLKVTHEQYDAAQMLARNCRRTLADVFADCDVLLAPSAPGGAPAGLDITGDPVFSRIWTLLRTPCVTVPAATANGLPVGVQIIGAFGNDAQTLAAAHWVHQALT
jgi:amidase